MRVGILGHVGNQNLGDEAIIAAVIQNLRRRWPNAEIIGFTAVPTDTRERHGITSFPIDRAGGIKPPEESLADTSATPGQPTASSFFQRIKDRVKRIPIFSTVARRIIRSLAGIPEIGREIGFLIDSRQHTKQLDLLIFAGSHQLNDYVGGPWSFPYTVLKWTLLARAAGARVVFLSLGAGPIDTWLGRRFIRQALRLASYRSYRDEHAKQVVDSIYASETDKIVPDLAFSLDPPAASNKSNGAGGRVVGINPLPFFAPYYWHEGIPGKYEAYVAKLAEFSDWLVNRDYEVHFVPTQLKIDPRVIADVRKLMTAKCGPEHVKLIVEPEIRSLDDLLSAISELDLMVATRYHGILLSLAMDKPVLAIAYHEKSRDLMNWLGQGDYVMPAETFSVEALTERLPVLENASDAIAAALGQRNIAFRASVNAQYDNVFKLMESIA